MVKDPANILLHLNMGVFKRRKAFSHEADWSPEEIRTLLKYLKRNKFNFAEAKSMLPARSPAAIRSKVRKLRIKNDLFGNSYREAKLQFTTSVGRKFQPSVVYDAYAGVGHQTFEWIKHAEIVYASEKTKSKVKGFLRNAEAAGFSLSSNQHSGWMQLKNKHKKIFLFEGDALHASCLLRSEGVHVDLLDLDTCGSTLPTLPMFLSILKPKHLIITHGEFHSLRFKRDDVLRRLLVHRGITKSSLPLSVEKMCTELDKAVKISGLRSHNETQHSTWLKLKKEIWLGGKFHGMLRRHYAVIRPPATADCLNELV